MIPVNEQAITKIWDAAIAAVHPANLMRQHIAIQNNNIKLADQQFLLSDFRHLYLIGVGKASAAMATEAAKILGKHLTDSLITIKHGHEVEGAGINMVSASHPVPDEYSVEAVNNTLKFLEKVGENDLVIFLLSGGASALWCDIPDGLNMPDLSQTYNLLINSGAAIDEINVVRKHLSLVKGGRLTNYCKGRIASLIISDVPGDDLSIIGSGPTYPNTSTVQDALAIIDKYKITEKIPESVLTYLKKGALRAPETENPNPNNTDLLRVTNTIVGANEVAVRAAAKTAEELGYHVYLSDRLITGETQQEAQHLIASLLQNNFKKPYCIIQGGETVIKVTGNGKGGRNQHFALVALKELALIKNQISAKDVVLLSCGTDGTDGPTDAAGAMISIATLDRAAEKNISIDEYLTNHNAYHFFEKTGGLIKTGPTQTNVMDIQVMMVS